MGKLRVKTEMEGVGGMSAWAARGRVGAWARGRGMSARVRGRVVHERARAWEHECMRSTSACGARASECGA